MINVALENQYLAGIQTPSMKHFRGPASIFFGLADSRGSGHCVAKPFILRTGANTILGAFPNESSRLPPWWGITATTSLGLPSESETLVMTNNVKSLRIQTQRVKNGQKCHPAQLKTHISTQSIEPRNWHLGYCDVRKGPSRESEDIVRGQ
jgi:hypothetical protein